MGAHPCFYFTSNQIDIRAALEVLREQEFKAGRYDPAMSMTDPPSYMFKFKFPPDDSSPAPGARHDSIDRVLAASDESGTGSILDIMRISDQPDFLAACPLPSDELIDLSGTAEPTRERLETVLRPKRREGIDDAAWTAALRLAGRFWDTISRGQGRYVVLYDKGGATRDLFRWLLPSIEGIQPGDGLSALEVARTFFETAPYAATSAPS